MLLNERITRLPVASIYSFVQRSRFYNESGGVPAPNCTEREPPLFSCGSFFYRKEKRKNRRKTKLSLKNDRENRYEKTTTRKLHEKSSKYSLFFSWFVIQCKRTVSRLQKGCLAFAYYARKIIVKVIIMKLKNGERKNV